MHKYWIALAALLWSVGLAWAITITLSTSETVNVPTALKVRWLTLTVDISQKLATITYQFLDPTDTPIREADTFRATKTFRCQDIPAPYPDNNHCLGPNDPVACCTNTLTGTCNVIISSCFTDTFLYTLESGDVGKKVGVILRNKLWNQMKTTILTGGNDGTFNND